MPTDEELLKALAQGVLSNLPAGFGQGGGGIANGAGAMATGGGGIAGRGGDIVLGSAPVAVDSNIHFVKLAAIRRTLADHLNDPWTRKGQRSLGAYPVDDVRDQFQRSARSVEQIKEIFPGVFDDYSHVCIEPANDPPGYYKRSQLENLARSLDEIVAIGESLNKGVSRVPPNESVPSSAAHHVSVYGNVYGAVQAGNATSAHVEQSWYSPEAEALSKALLQVRDTLISQGELDLTVKSDLREELERALYETQKKAPKHQVLLRILTGIGAGVQTIGALAPAWETTKAAAKAFGIALD